MRLHAMTVVVCALTALGGHARHEPAVAAGSQPDRAADLAAIEKLRQQDIAATVARDPVALTDLWAEDAIRLGVGAPPEIGKTTIRTSNERQTANKSFKVLSYVPETKDFTFLEGGWAVEWRTYTASYVDSPGGEAEARAWHCAGGVQEAPGRQLESFPRAGVHGARGARQSRWLVM